MKKLTLNQLEAKESELLQQLAIVRNDMREINSANWEMKTGIKIGDKISFKRGLGTSYRPNEGILKCFVFDGGKIDYLEYYPLNVTGEPSKNVRRLWKHEESTLKKI